MTHRRNSSLTAALILPLALLGTTAFAADTGRPNYKFVELDYVYSTLSVQADALSQNQNDSDWFAPESAALKGSWVFLDEQLLVRGSYMMGSGKWKSTYDVDTSSAVVSAGWLVPTTDATGIDVSLEYRADNVQLDRPNKYDEDIDGLGVVFGVRANVTEQLEVGLRAGWYEGDFNGSVGFNVNAAWNITDQWAVTAFWDRMDADVNDSKVNNYENNQYAIGGRYSF